MTREELKARIEEEKRYIEEYSDCLEDEEYFIEQIEAEEDFQSEEDLTIYEKRLKRIVPLTVSIFMFLVSIIHLVAKFKVYKSNIFFDILYLIEVIIGLWNYSSVHFLNKEIIDSEIFISSWKLNKFKIL